LNDRGWRDNASFGFTMCLKASSICRRILIMAMNESNQLLCVRLGDQEFALNIRAVREIRGWISSTPLPHAPPYIKGMINLRGSVLAILDLAERLGLPSVPANATSVVVVIEEGERVIGLLVDAVSDIITETAEMRQVPPETGSAAS